MSGTNPALAAGVALLGQRRFAEAATELQRVTRDEPMNVAAWGYLAAALNMLRQYANALAAADYAIRLNPSIAWIWVEKARALRQIPGDRDREAVAAAERALSLDVNFAPAHLERATALANLNAFEAALPELDWAMRLQPAYASALAQKGRVLVQMGYTREGINLCERATIMESGNGSVWRVLAGAYMDCQQYSAAIPPADRALDIDPYDYGATLIKALALGGIGEVRQAKWWAARAEALQPNDPNVREYQGMLNQTQRDKNLRTAGRVGRGVFGVLWGITVTALQALADAIKTTIRSM